MKLASRSVIARKLSEVGLVDLSHCFVSSVFLVCHLVSSHVPSIFSHSSSDLLYLSVLELNTVSRKW